MHAKLFTLALFSTSALAMQGFINQPSFGVMLKRGHAIAKRQGYDPQTESCPGRGNTCAEVCGAETVQCPSNDPDTLSCHSSLDGSYCCPDNSGIACGSDFYCTSDTVGGTYCCLENLDEAECALGYGVPSLIRQSTAVELPTTTASSALPAETPVETLTETETDTEFFTTSSEIPVETDDVSFTTTDIVVISTASASVVILTTSLPNATFSTPSLSEFTGGAAKATGLGMAVIAGAAGLAFI